MATILDFKNWNRIFEQDSNQGTSEFIYSESNNPTDAGRENNINMQQYLVNMFGGVSTLEGMIGKTLYLYNKPAILKENEIAKFVVAGVETKSPKDKKVANTYLYSNNVEKVKAPYIRISNVNNIRSFSYHKSYEDSLGTVVYNEELMTFVKSLMGA